jgi:hypothetical protein
MEFLKVDILDLPRGYEDVFIDYLKNPPGAWNDLPVSSFKSEETGRMTLAGKCVNACRNCENALQLLSD